jgi:hypothetical protein
MEPKDKETVVRGLENLRGPGRIGQLHLHSASRRLEVNFERNNSKVLPNVSL